MSQQEAPSIRQLIVEVKTDAQRLLRAQSELAKSEVKSNQQAAAATGGLFAVTAGAAMMGGIFLLITVAYVLVALGLPVWAGFGIVTLLLFLTAGITAALGRSRAQRIKGIPRSKAELEATKRALSGGPAEATALVVGDGATTALDRTTAERATADRPAK